MPEMLWFPVSGSWEMWCQRYLHANHVGWSDTMASIGSSLILSLGQQGLEPIQKANEMTRCAPLACLILETDSPHLKPKDAPRGTATDPIMAMQVARRIAVVKKISLQEVLTVSTTWIRLSRSFVYSVHMLIWENQFISVCVSRVSILFWELFAAFLHLKIDRGGMCWITWINIRYSCDIWRDVPYEMRGGSRGISGQLFPRRVACTISSRTIFVYPGQDDPQCGKRLSDYMYPYV